MLRHSNLQENNGDLLLSIFEVLFTNVVVVFTGDDVSKKSEERSWRLYLIYFTQDSLFINSNELLSTRVLCLFCETPTKETMKLAGISNIQLRRPHRGLNS